MQVAWKVLGGMGIVLIMLAFNLDTAVGSVDGQRIHNLSLQSRQQMILILGCALFLAGVVLFGIDKIKQPPESAQGDQKQTPIRPPKNSEAKEKVFRKLEGFLDIINPGSDFVFSRLVMGVLLGLLWANVGADASKSSAVGTVLFLAAMVGCLWRAPAATAISRMALLHVAATVVMLGILIVTKRGAQSLGTVLADPRLYMILGLLLGLPSIVAALLVFRIRRKTSQSRTTPIEETQLHKGPC